MVLTALFLFYSFLLFCKINTFANLGWYYEHKLPEGQKSYSKIKPIQFNEFQPIIDWWDNRKESEVCWKVNAKELKNWDLDIKNPTVEKEEEMKSSKEIMRLLKDSLKNEEDLMNKIH